MMNNGKVKQYLADKQMNSPTASHQGGVWERQIEQYTQY